MRIGREIDGVLTNVEHYVEDYFTKYCVENGIKYKVGESDYEHYKTFSVTKKVEDEFWTKYILEYAVNEKVRPFASEVIDKLKSEGHEIYIITARWLSNRDDELGHKMREIVKEWLIKNEINYDKLIFSKATKERKSKEIIDNKIDLMIEDSPKNIDELSKIVQVICYNSSYNINCEGNNIIRCYSWYDIYKIIHNM